MVQFHNHGFTLSVNADTILEDSLWCFNIYNWCLCRFIDKLYTLFLTSIIHLSEICIILYETFWIKLKLDYFIMKLGPYLDHYVELMLSHTLSLKSKSCPISCQYRVSDVTYLIHEVELMLSHTLSLKRKSCPIPCQYRVSDGTYIIHDVELMFFPYLVIKEK